MCLCFLTSFRSFNECFSAFFCFSIAHSKVGAFRQMFSQRQYETFGHIDLCRLDDSQVLDVCGSKTLQGVNGTSEEHSGKLKGNVYEEGLCTKKWRRRIKLNLNLTFFSECEFTYVDHPFLIDSQLRIIEGRTFQIHFTFGQGLWCNDFLWRLIRKADKEAGRHWRHSLQFRRSKQKKDILWRASCALVRQMKQSWQTKDTHLMQANTESRTKNQLKRGVNLTGLKILHNRNRKTVYSITFVIH